MSFDIDQYFNKIIEEFQVLSHVNPVDLPNIDLYMDQVTTFMDTKLASTKRNPEDKILTKTMINNYAKNNVLPAPVKKKYSKEHMLMLIFIYYFKSMISITDIKTLFQPMSDHFFNNDKGLNIEDIYNVIYKNCKADLDSISADIKKKFEESKDNFTEESGKSKEYLQLYSFVCSMAFDVYIKKLLIEQIIDGYFEDYASKKQQKASNKEKPQGRPKK